jgi:hypothetical protein
MRWMDEVCGASGGCPGRSMVVRLCTEMPWKITYKPFLKDTENKITLKEKKTLQSAPLNHPAKPFCPIWPLRPASVEAAGGSRRPAQNGRRRQPQPPGIHPCPRTVAAEPPNRRAPAPCPRTVAAEPPPRAPTVGLSEWRIDDKDPPSSCSPDLCVYSGDSPPSSLDSPPPPRTVFVWFAAKISWFSACLLLLGRGAFYFAGAECCEVLLAKGEIFASLSTLFVAWLSLSSSRSSRCCSSTPALRPGLRL